MVSPNFYSHRCNECCRTAPENNEFIHPGAANSCGCNQEPQNEGRAVYGSRRDKSRGSKRTQKSNPEVARCLNCICQGSQGLEYLVKIESQRIFVRAILRGSSRYT